MKKLMEIAIDTTVRELAAGEGFIVLVNDNLEIETVVSKNMPPEKENAVKEISTSIIKNTVNELKPLQLDDIKAESAQKHSIIEKFPRRLRRGASFTMLLLAAEKNII